MYGITRDELAAMRRFLPEWSRESTILPNKDKDGNYIIQILVMVLHMIQL